MILLSLSPQLPVNIHRKLGKEVRHNPPPRLTERGISAFRKRIARLRQPRRRDHAPAERAAIQRPLRTHLLLAPVIRQKIPHHRMPRPWPESAAPALIVTRL